MTFSHFKRLMMKAIRWVAWTLVIFLVITILLSAGIFVTLWFAEHNGKLDQWIKEGTGWSITYDRMHLGVHALNPSIVLENVVLKDPKDPKAEFDLKRLEVDLSIWSTILERTPVTSQLLISGLNLNVQELPKNEWQVNGMIFGAPNAQSNLLEDILAWLLQQKKIGIKNLDLHLVLGDGDAYDFKPVNLTWYGRDHHLKIDTSMLSIPGNKLHLEIDFFPGKDLTHFAEWQFRFNGNATADDFSPLFRGRSVYQLKFLSGGGELDFNGLIQNGDLDQLQMGVSLKNLNLTHANASPLSIDKVDEEIFWQNFGAGNGWSLRIQPISGAASALGSPGAGMLTVSHHPNDLVHTWVLVADDIDLGVLGEWVNFAFTADTQVEKVWSLLNPEGTIQHLQVIGNQAQGTISFKGKDLNIDANEMFPQGWPDSRLIFNGTWQQTAQKKAWMVKLNALDLENDNLRLAAQGSLSVPLLDPANPYINLSASLQGKDLQKVSQYYIPQTLSKGLVRWLNQGLVQLPNVNATLSWKGKLDDMPYADKAHPGAFHLEVDTQNAVIQPWINWPLITDLNAKLIINNQRFTIDAANAKTEGVPLQQVHLELKDMRPHTGNAIVITGNATPTGAQALTYLADMPVVSQRIQNVIKTEIRLSGVVPLSLNVQIPLVHAPAPAPTTTTTTTTTPGATPITVTGTAIFKGNNLIRVVDKQDTLWFKNMGGVINFQNQYVWSNSFYFVFKDLPCTVQVVKSPVNDLHVLVPEIQLYGQSYKAVNVFIQPAPDNTPGVVKNPLVTFVLNDPNAVGQVVLEPDGSFAGNLDKLIIVPPEQSASAPVVENKKNKKKAVPVDTTQAIPQDYLSHLGKLLSEMPPLNMTVKSFYYGADNLGSLMLQSHPMSDGIAIQHLTMGDSDATLDIAGSIVTHNNQDEISVAGALNGSNFGNALGQLGYPDVVDGGSGSIQFELNWFGALFHPEWATLQGDFNFNVNNGKFLKVNTGLAQILGLLSLNTVASTFSLDFKGIFSGGFGFSSIQGGYHIHNGIAYTDDLRINGPTANVQVKGNIDLVNQTIDQVLVIQPQVGTSVAIAATVIGGPIAGAATFVANELLNRTVLRNSGFTYRITGPLDKPVATPVTVAEQPSG